MNVLEIPFATIFEWLCLFAAILFIGTKPNPRYWVWFVPFLLLTVSVETSSFIARKSIEGFDSQWLYNLFMLIYAPFHIYILSKIIDLPAIKVLSIIILLLLGLIYVWEWNEVGFAKFFSVTNTIFGGSTIALSLLYYYTLFKAENHPSFVKIPEFWFVTGCIVFYSSTTGVNAFFTEIINLSKIYNFPIRFAIFNLFNIIMYSCWIKAFLCLRNSRMYFQQSY